MFFGRQRPTIVKAAIPAALTGSLVSISRIPTPILCRTLRRPRRIAPKTCTVAESPTTRIGVTVFPTKSTPLEPWARFEVQAASPIRTVCCFVTISAEIPGT